MGELPATPLCPEVLSIAVDLLFISGQDQGASGPLLGLQWPHSRALLPKPSPFPVRPLFCASFLQPLSAQRCSLGPCPYLPLKMKFWVSQWHIWTIHGPPPCLSFAPLLTAPACVASPFEISTQQDPSRAARSSSSSDPSLLLHALCQKRHSRDSLASRKNALPVCVLSSLSKPLCHFCLSLQ